MTNPRRMPALSPEEIRKISADAVASVAAQKIVTNNVGAVIGSAKAAGFAKSREGQTRASHRTPEARACVSGGTVTLTDKARKILKDSALTQSQSRGFFQESFNAVRKTIKS